MDREVTSSYSINSSHISYTSNMNYLFQDSNVQTNLLDMLRSIRQDEENYEEENNSDRASNGISNSSNTINSDELFAEMSLLSNDKHINEDNNDEQLSYDPDHLVLNQGRASTAPVKPINEVEEFKWSVQYSNLKKAVLYCNSLIILQPDTKFDVDSEEGAEICKKFLEQMEKLIKSLKVPTSSREYRKNFSRAYKYLYQEGNLCYLTEILDSAQEGIQCLWVNGEKYSFSKEVLEHGNKLYNNFCQILVLLRNSYQRITDDSFFENIHQIKIELKKGLEEFDKNWVTYEQNYISELIEIENKSRRYIIQAIEIEKELTTYEIRAKCRGKILIDNDEYNNMRHKLVNLFVQINKVANSEGKGRDDLTIDILTQAEAVLRKVSENKSKPVRHMAEKIKKTFMQFRELLRKFDENIEMVDPQLKNNVSLVELLFIFESSWEKGKEYLLNQQKYKQLLYFSQMIEILCEKYKDISEQLESRDPNIFVWIPSILILKSLDYEDIEICYEFIPSMFDQNEENGKLYLFLKEIRDKLYKQINDKFTEYNLLEKFILYEGNEELIKYLNKAELDEFLKKLKFLSMQMQRVKPTEWNYFFDLAMDCVNE